MVSRSLFFLLEPADKIVSRVLGDTDRRPAITAIDPSSKCANEADRWPAKPNELQSCQKAPV